MRIAKLANNMPTKYSRNVGIVNMGDSIISLAMDHVFDIAKRDRSEMIKLPFCGSHKVEEECILLISGHFGHQHNMDFINHTKIHPIFLGVALMDTMLTEKERTYFKRYEPILCRDEFTRNVFRNYNIDAYVFGCITLLLPDNWSKKGSKIFFVDVKDVYKDKLPKDVIANSVFLSQNMAYKDFNATDWSNESEYASTRLKSYANDAKLVVTSKLHCMTPCVAMGVPVVALGENFSYRYGYIDAFVDAYNSETINKIPWENVQKNDESIKYVRSLMKDIVRSAFEFDVEVNKIKELDAFYENRKRWEYFHGIKKIIEPFFLHDESQDYVLWGASAGGYAVNAYIAENMKNVKLVGVADVYARGIFAGLQIEKPEEIIKKFPKAKIIISTLSGKEEAIKYLESIGKREKMDYVFAHESM